MKVTAVIDAYVVQRIECLPDGDSCAVLQIPGDGQYDEYRKLPSVISIDGTIYAVTGWNSDRGEAYYRSNRKVARKV